MGFHDYILNSRFGLALDLLTSGLLLVPAFLYLYHILVASLHPPTWIMILHFNRYGEGFIEICLALSILILSVRLFIRTTYRYNDHRED